MEREFPKMDIEKEAKKQSEDRKVFEELLRGAKADPWWHRLLIEVKRRRAIYAEELETGTQDQRAEDRIRGQISELKWILALDAYASTQKKVENHGTRKDDV